MDCIVACAIVPLIVFRYGVPLRYRSVESNARKPAAISKGILADVRHTAPDCHARESRAILEGLTTDTRHVVGYGYARKPGAIVEGLTTDTRHASVRRNDTCFTT